MKILTFTLLMFFNPNLKTNTFVVICRNIKTVIKAKKPKQKKNKLKNLFIKSIVF
jgi:hypothetical protein